jgi:hypothetical protein
VRVIRIGPETDVPELADLLDVSRASVVETGFRLLDRLLTIKETVDFKEAVVIAAEFGAIVEPK